MTFRLPACLAVALALPVVSPHIHAQIIAEWDAAAETAVVFNPDFPGSAELAAYYAEKRHIPKEHVIGLRCSQESSISRADFEEQLRQPLLKVFESRHWWISQPPLPGKPLTGDGIRSPLAPSPHVRMLVLMRGVPYQIRRGTQNPKPSEEDEASVDSELTTLGLDQPPIKGGVRNPYFDQQARFPNARNTSGLLIVGRLDGPDDDTVKHMIDDAIYAEEHGLLGRAVIDLAKKTGAYQEGETWLKNSADSFRRAGIPVFIDPYEPLLRDLWPLPDTILYFGWYTDHITGALASPSFRFKRGAIACHLHSFSASIIRAHDKAWAGPLLSHGAAVTFGNVFEPYLSLTIHFDIFNRRLLEGFTVGEAAWNATPALSWMNVVLGDPLYRPYGKGIGAKLGEGAERDYALYQGMALRLAGEPDSHVKTTLTELASKRKSTLLLELTALLSALQSKLPQALELLEHAESTAHDPADMLRLRLYRAEMLRRSEQAGAARALLREVLQDARFKDLPARAAAESLLNDMGG
ncbi:TIGR03790 family protein [Prosthecobacter sp.]|uniref:TIGR03790 family protein n=1 Tax=Prosthecobacter sp. TaxID=1965333 RepID=UPI001DEC1FEC|nr:TIGR03790 family protein [Prosthecobacter sp.]MCB1276545.1 TIGR03790 family protein [Prosthecobacter sp.]